MGASRHTSEIDEAGLIMCYRATVAVLVVAYFGTLAALALLGLERFQLAMRSLCKRPPRSISPGAWPPVLVQLPLYNERFVAERLIRAASLLDYPQDLLRLQVLDDSDDETRRVVDDVALELRAHGIDIQVVRRRSRTGYKAGALAHGLRLAPTRFAYVALFDADFVPQPDFLKRSLPFLLARSDIGLVQARWAHLNRDETWLTKAQGVFLDGHFGVEHSGRWAMGRFFNFNGTAGVWNRHAIEDAGGWSGDTITEDLDLSYRAQLAGWSFVYLHDVVCPAELPSTISAFRQQQSRWVRGSAQTARKLLGPIWRAPGISCGQRLSASLHLTNNFAYVAMALLAVLLPAAVVVRDQAGWRVFGGQSLLSSLDLGSLVGGTTAMVIFYMVGLWRAGALSVPRFFDLGMALCLGAGMSLSNAVEVLRGLSASGAEFARTPKKGSAGEVAQRVYRSGAPTGRAWCELAFALYYAAATAYAVYFGLWGALPFFALYLFGFVGVGWATWRSLWEQTIVSPAPERLRVGS
ncbi:MAG: glycosyltransferase [Myxococcota bacterium]